MPVTQSSRGLRCPGSYRNVSPVFDLLGLFLVAALSLGCSPAAPNPTTAEPVTEKESHAESPPADAAGEEIVQDQGTNLPATSLPFSIAEATNWTVRFSDMQAVLNLNDEQQARLKEAFADHAEALKAWYAQYGDKLVDLDKRFMSAVRQRDLGTMRQIGAQAKGLKETATELYRDYQRGILEALPDEKRHEWQVHVVSKRFREIVASLELTPEQINSVSRLVATAVEQAPETVHWEGEALGRLKQLFEREVLRDDQRQLWQEVNKANPLQWLKGLSGQ